MDRVFVVTVTYGRRWHLLSQTLMAVLGSEQIHVIVVDNGADEPIAEACAKDWAEQATVVTLPRNTGSAFGYKTGIQAALDAGAEYILLLDDDNLVEPTAVNCLLATLKDLAKEWPLDKLAVMGFRPGQQADIAKGISTTRLQTHPDSFIGFHLKDVPFKLWRRLPWLNRKQPTSPQLPERVKMDMGPYGGTFFHASVIKKYGLPDERFVLYADDCEFSYRITRDGGAIWLIPTAPIVDIETSWCQGKRFGSRLEAWLRGDSEMRAYYSARNQAYFGKYCRAHRRVVRYVNRAAYLTILFLLAWRWHRMARYHMLRRALQDGEQAKLGLHESYPL